KEMTEHRQGFEDSVAALDPAIAEKVVPFVEACRVVLDAYDQTALDVLDGFLTSLDRSMLLAGADNLRRCIFQLNAGFNSYRDAVLVAQGPSDVPLYNLMLPLLKAVKDGQAPIQQLVFYIEGERIRAKGNLVAMEKGLPELPEVQQLRKAWETQLETATRFGKAAVEKNWETAELELDLLRDNMRSLNTLMLQAELAVRSTGPSPSPLVNLLVNTGRRMAIGQAQAYEFLPLFEELKHGVRGIAVQLEVIQTEAAAGDRDGYAEVITAGKQAFEHYDEGFRLIEAFFEGRVVENLQRGLELVLKASTEQQTAHQKLLDQMEKQGKVSCIKCGHPSSPGRLRCERCGTPLPLAPPGTPTSVLGGQQEGVEVQTAEADQPIVTENLRRLYDAVNRVAEGSLSVEKYLETVQWFEELVETQLSNIGPIRAPADMEGADVAKAQEHFDSFKESVREAISELRAYSGDPNKTHLMNGVRLSNHAANELVRMEKALNPGAETKGLSQTAGEMMG
ncbi:MAG: hypothetical protein ACYCW6_17790, partial [Candidatus Xenobia bacterium]